MYWIILKGPNGERKIESGKPYRLQPGESIAGTQQDNSIADYSHPDETANLLAEIELELHSEGHGLGDWVKYFIKPVARIIGKKSCLSCEARKATLNALAKLTEQHGRAEAKRIVKGLMLRSFTEPPEAILKDLREALQ